MSENELEKYSLGDKKQPTVPHAIYKDKDHSMARIANLSFMCCKQRLID